MQPHVTQPTLLPLIRALRSLATLAALALGLLFWAEEADARLESELGFGATGVSALTSQAVAIFDDDTACDGAGVSRAAAQPAAPGGSLVDLFSRPGLVGGFAAGFLGAGLLGLLFGQGVAGGLSGIAACLGLLFQLALIVVLARLIWTWWHNDKAAHPSPRQLADAYGSPRHERLPDINSPAMMDSALGETSSDAAGVRRRPAK